jgi:hypothetical protein
MKQIEAETVPALALTLKLSGKVTVPPTSERVMRHCAKLGEFPVFKIGNSSRQYVMIEELREWMKKKGTKQ